MLWIGLWGLYYRLRWLRLLRSLGTSKCRNGRIDTMLFNSSGEFIPDPSFERRQFASYDSIRNGPYGVPTFNIVTHSLFARAGGPQVCFPRTPQMLELCL